MLRNGPGCAAYRNRSGAADRARAIPGLRRGRLCRGWKGGAPGEIAAAILTGDTRHDGGWTLGRE
jgi:hypothetical protein